MKEYRIAWQSKVTGKEGEGLWVSENYLPSLIRTKDDAAKEWPNYDHWIEERDMPQEQEAAHE